MGDLGLAALLLLGARAGPGLTAERTELSPIGLRVAGI